MEIQKFSDAVHNFESINEFIAHLNAAPAQERVQKNTLANNANYLPIGWVESQLDSIYHGLWSWVADVKIMGNSIVSTGILEVYHPVAKVWIKRTGIGAETIQLKKDSNGDIIPQNITKVAFEGGCANAKSEALKNASKSLGAFFGRNLNRKGEFDVITISESVAKEMELQEQLTDLYQKCCNLIPTAKVSDDEKKTMQTYVDSVSSDLEKLKKAVERINQKK